MVGLLLEWTPRSGQRSLNASAILESIRPVAARVRTSHCSESISKKACRRSTYEIARQFIRTSFGWAFPWLISQKSSYLGDFGFFFCLYISSPNYCTRKKTLQNVCSILFPGNEMDFRRHLLFMKISYNTYEEKHNAVLLFLYLLYTWKVYDPAEKPFSFIPEAKQNDHRGGITRPQTDEQRTVQRKT